MKLLLNYEMFFPCSYLFRDVSEVALNTRVTLLNWIEQKDADGRVAVDAAAAGDGLFVSAAAAADSLCVASRSCCSR